MTGEPADVYRAALYATADEAADAYRAATRYDTQTAADHIARIAMLGPASVHLALRGWASVITRSWPAPPAGRRWTVADLGHLRTDPTVVLPSSIDFLRLLVADANDDHAAVSAIVEKLWTATARDLGTFLGEALIGVVILSHPRHAPSAAPKVTHP